MIKKLLTITAIIATVGLNAQSGKSIRKSTLKEITFGNSNVILSPRTVTVSQTCDSITTFDYSSSSTTINIDVAGTDSTVPTCTAIAGYVYGTNCYSDKEKTNFNDGATYYNSISNVSVTAVRVLFWADPTMGMGMQGGVSATVGMKLYTGNVTGGPTGAGLGSTVVPMSAVLSATSSSNAFFFYTFNFANPVPVPAAGFFASVVLPNPHPGDTAVVAAQFSPTANIVWEKFNDNSWHAVTETPASWGAPGNLAIIPKYCFQLSGVGLSQNLGISENVWVYPNPSTGIVNISTTFLKEENISVTVTNTLGQVIATTKKNALIDMLTLDLSDQSNGVYFVSITNGTDKMITRLVLNK